MDFAALIAQMDDQRARWIDDLPDLPGKKLRVMRPLETDLDQLRTTTLRGMAEGIAPFVVGWAGFTEADFVGASQGSDAEVPFNAALFVRWLRDRMPVVAALGEAIKASIDTHREAKEAARKN